MKVGVEGVDKEVGGEIFGKKKVQKVQRREWRGWRRQVGERDRHKSGVRGTDRGSKKGPENELR